MSNDLDEVQPSDGALNLDRLVEELRNLREALEISEVRTRGARQELVDLLALQEEVVREKVRDVRELLASVERLLDEGDSAFVQPVAVLGHAATELALVAGRLDILRRAKL